MDLVHDVGLNILPWATGRIINGLLDALTSIDDERVRGWVEYVREQAKSKLHQDVNSK